MEDLSQVWRKSSHSGNGGECVEVGRAADGLIVVRDTKNRSNGSVCLYSPAGWHAFTAGARTGKFDVDKLAATVVWGG
jgi:hypothetical protein